MNLNNQFKRHSYIDEIHYLHFDLFKSVNLINHYIIMDFTLRLVLTNFHKKLADPET